MIAYIQWDPNPFCFTIPFIGKKIAWYGVLFAVGFLCSRSVGIKLAESRFGARGREVIDALFTYVFWGTVLGARLGHLLFYEPIRKLIKDPLSILRVWDGGLASHGAVIGILFAVALFAKRKKIEMLFLFDVVAVASMAAGPLIRLGNFINQEIIGKAASVPWAVIFVHPFDGSIAVPRHPVQLYEAVVYLMFLGIFLLIWKKVQYPGIITGVYFSAVFGARALLEFFKEPQSVLEEALPCTMGQILSIPVVLAGVALLGFVWYQRKRMEHSPSNPILD